MACVVYYKAINTKVKWKVEQKKEGRCMVGG